jgi:hypothetical protein
MRGDQPNALDIEELRVVVKSGRQAINPLDPMAVTDAICGTMSKCRAPLSDNQRILLVGALSIWLTKARDAGVSEAVAAFKSALELDDAGYTSAYLSQREQM